MAYSPTPTPPKAANFADLSQVPSTLTPTPPNAANSLNFADLSEVSYTLTPTPPNAANSAKFADLSEVSSTLSARKKCVVAHCATTQIVLLFFLVSNCTICTKKKNV